jgi:hypothetical protein
MDEQESNRRAQHTAGEQRCMFGSAESYCGEPAVAHVLQLSGHPTMSCPKHLYVWTMTPFSDVHEIGANCGLPGMTWLCSCCEPPGRCASDLDDAEANLWAEAKALGIR